MVEEAVALFELEEKNPDRTGPEKSTILSKVQKNKKTKVEEAVEVLRGPVSLELEEKNPDGPGPEKSTILSKVAEVALGQVVNDKTTAKYEKDWKHFLSFLEPNNKPEHVTEIALLNYFGSIQNDFVPSTLRSKHSSLKNRAVHNYDFNIDPFFHVSKLLSSLEKNSRHTVKKSIDHVILQKAMHESSTSYRTLGHGDSGSQCTWQNK